MEKTLNEEAEKRQMIIIIITNEYKRQGLPNQRVQLERNQITTDHQPIIERALNTIVFSSFWIFK